MRDERKKQARSNKAKQHSTPKAVTFPRKMSCLGWDSNPRLYSRQSALPTELPRQLSWLGPNLTSHSTPDEQANHVRTYYTLYDGWSIECCIMYMYVQYMCILPVGSVSVFRKDIRNVAVVSGPKGIIHALQVYSYMYYHYVLSLCTCTCTCTITQTGYPMAC